VRLLKAEDDISILVGLMAGVGAHLLGPEFAFFWGVLMFIFNYIPVSGSFWPPYRR